MSSRILVVEGNTTATSALITKHGGQPYGEFYSALLERLAPGATTSIARPADAYPDDLSPTALREQFDGVVWTGSALSVYESIPEVKNQLRLADAVLEAELPVFGSCWGLQIFATALGGSVHKNPRGREIGLTSPITLTDVGATHPMYTDKPGPFHAYAVHSDEVDRLPTGATILASNEMSEVQAMEHGTVWAVQYHPEFDRQTMAATYRRLAHPLVRESFYPSEDAVEATAVKLAQSPEPDGGRQEIQNWLKQFA